MCYSCVLTVDTVKSRLLKASFKVKRQTFACASVGTVVWRSKGRHIRSVSTKCRWRWASSRPTAWRPNDERQVFVK
jgi:hypothetical protein